MNYRLCKLLTLTTMLATAVYAQGSENSATKG